MIGRSSENASKGLPDIDLPGPKINSSSNYSPYY